MTIRENIWTLDKTRKIWRGDTPHPWNDKLGRTSTISSIYNMKRYLMMDLTILIKIYISFKILPIYILKKKGAYMFVYFTFLHIPCTKKNSAPQKLTYKSILKRQYI
jgi:hypothetical protein